VAGVVPIESPAGWGATGGEAALEAQAVAARSYVLSYLYEVGHTCDSAYCQVYEGDPGTNPDIGLYVRYSNRAIRSSAGPVVCRVLVTSCPLAKVVSTQYASSTGGYTSGVGSPGFPAVVDAGDAVSANPWHDWTIYLAVSAVEAAYPSVSILDPTVNVRVSLWRARPGQRRPSSPPAHGRSRQGSIRVPARPWPDYR
jgi:stage II sporulation protein D